MSVTREKLYEEIWAEPITKVAKRYEISDSFLIRVCKKLNVPRPAKGHWAKLAAGKKSIQALLPKAKPGDEIEWVRYGMAKREPHPDPVAPTNKMRRLRQLKNRPSRHKLIIEAAEYFKNVRDTNDEYLKPYKKLCIDLLVSQTSLSRALDVANELFLQLEDRGHRLAIGVNNDGLHRESFDEREKITRNNRYTNFWAPWQPTLVFIGTVAIGINIFETSEEVELRYVNGEYLRESEIASLNIRPARLLHSWTTTRNLPSGRFAIQAYSPYNGTSWKQIWREAKAGDYPSKLSTIVKALAAEAINIAESAKQARIQAEIRHKEWELQRERLELQHQLELKEKARMESKSQLLKIIEHWAEIKRIEEFFKDIETRLTDLPEDEKKQIESLLKEARELVGDLNAIKHFKKWNGPKLL